MSDLVEPDALNKARLEEKLFEFQLSMKRMARRRLELQYETDKLTENEEATRKAMAEIEKNIKG